MASVAGLRAVVTGAASGIGHAVTEQLIKGRAAVAGLDRNEPTASVERHVTVDLGTTRSRATPTTSRRRR